MEQDHLEYRQRCQLLDKEKTNKLKFVSYKTMMKGVSIK